jgi:oligopeptide transport system substrate-binding protein
MKYFSLLILSASVFIFGCSSKKPQSENAGGVFSFCIESSPSTFTARDITDNYSAAFTTQVIEGLVTLDPKSLRPRPQLAKSYSVSEDGLTYTFILKENILFHENDAFESDDDRLFVAEDVIATFEADCKPSAKGDASSAYNMIFENNVLGANDFYAGKTKSIVGIKGSGSKLFIKLVAPDLNFLSKLGMSNAAISAKEIIDKKLETDLNGTGPFIYNKEVCKNSERLVLYKNEEYYLNDKQGKALPYLDSVVFYVQSKKLEQLDMFEKGTTQMISELPPSRITEMLETKIADFSSIPPKYFLNDQPRLKTQYYGFNMLDPRFQDPRVRQAFNYAIDRTTLVKEVLKGQAYEVGIFGIIPPISSYFRGYDFTGVKKNAYDYDPEKAKALLAAAGYPNGEGFGSVDLLVNVGDIHTAVAEEFTAQIKSVLNLNVNFSGVTFEIKNKEANMARGQLYRLAWSADYLSPENFLINFYGKLVPIDREKASTTNQTRYKNPLFDNYFEQAKAAKGEKAQFLLYSKAEQELMKDPPIIALWYVGVNELLYSRVRNLQNNPLQIFDFREVYFKEWTKEEYQKSIK